MKERQDFSQKSCKVFCCDHLFIRECLLPILYERFYGRCKAIYGVLVLFFSIMMLDVTCSLFEVTYIFVVVGVLQETPLYLHTTTT